MTPALKKAINAAILTRKSIEFAGGDSCRTVTTSQLRNELQVISAAIEVLPRGTTPRLDAEEALSHILAILEALEA